MGEIPSSIREKIDRARVHSDLLNLEMNTFVQDDPNATLGFVVEFDFDKGECFVRWGEHTKPPLRWSVILGEFFYDLRSALDHLAYQLVPVADRSDRTEFPVFWEPDKFHGRDKRKTKGMSDPALAVIESLQPFSEWPEHPQQTTLWRIHDLCNIDKHRLLHLADFFLASAAVKMLFPVPKNQTPPIEKRYLARREWLQPNAKIGHFAWDPSAMRALGDAEVQMEVELRLDISLTEGEWLDGNGQPAQGMPVYHLTKVALDCMDTTVLPKFAPFF